MKLVVLRLDGDVSRIKFCTTELVEFWVKDFSDFVTKITFDETRNSAKVEIFDIDLNDEISFTAEKFKRNKEVLTRFKRDKK